MVNGFALNYDRSSKFTYSMKSARQKRLSERCFWMLHTVTVSHEFCLLKNTPELIRLTFFVISGCLWYYRVSIGNKMSQEIT